jgi:hypothetical protein
VTTLALAQTFIAPLSNLSDVLYLAQSTESEESGAPVEVRRYAGGRQRVVSTPGTSGTLSFSYRFLTRTEYDDLLELVGVPVLVRDQRGRSYPGVISNVSGTEWNVSDKVEDASFTVEQISWSETV